MKDTRSIRQLYVVIFVYFMAVAIGCGGDGDSNPYDDTSDAGPMVSEPAENPYNGSDAGPNNAINDSGQLPTEFSANTIDASAPNSKNDQGVNNTDAPKPDNGAPPSPPTPPSPPSPPAPPPSNQGVAARERPFDPSHPVYQPIPANCPLASYSATAVANISQSHKNIFFDTKGETPAVYVGRPTDPTWDLVINGKTFKVHAPNSLVAGSGSDFPLVILDEQSAAYDGNPVEYRMWQASINTASKKITCSYGGVGVYANDGRILNYGKSKRALGQAEIFGSNTGSGLSYTVGMIRPIDIKQGRIPHAIRIAAAYISGQYVWPAIKTDQSGSTGSKVPMGSRVFLDHSVDLAPIYKQLEQKLSDPLNAKLAKMFVRALQEFGFIMSDGSGNNNVYFEHNATANWVPVIGKVNSSGSYNDVARAVTAAIPWDKLRVADPAVFANFGK